MCSREEADAKSSCWAQGWLISTGDLSCCAFTVGIALHTFLFLVYNYKASQRILYTVTLCLWLFVYIVPLAGILRTGNGRDVGGFYVRAIAWVSLEALWPPCKLTKHQ